MEILQNQFFEIGNNALKTSKKQRNIKYLQFRSYMILKKLENSEVKKIISKEIKPQKN